MNENHITGWLKIFRSFINWEWYTTPNMVHFFLHCLLKANHKDNHWRGILIKRGSFITSLDTLRKETGLTQQNVRTCLKRLEKSGEINKESNKQHTLITICNYSTYQDFTEISNTQANKQLTNNQQTANKQLTTNNNDNNINNDNTLYISEKEFLQDWKTAREKIDGNPTNISKLTIEESINFNLLKTEFTIEQFRNAIQGLFKQKDMFPATRLRPKHFLEDRNIEKYLDAFINNSQLYKKKELKL